MYEKQILCNSYTISPQQIKQSEKIAKTQTNEKSIANYQKHKNKKKKMKKSQTKK